MTEHPILFSTEMVKAILEGRKTQTRRIIKPQPIDNREIEGNFFNGNHKGYVKVDGHPFWQQQFAHEFCSYRQIGDTLWVRETWLSFVINNDSWDTEYAYKADEDPTNVFTKWKPSIHMPKKACRIRLKITDIKVERVQDISKEDRFNDICAEGYDFRTMSRDMGPLPWFKKLWHKINGEESWNSNVWVWVISFERV